MSKDIDIYDCKGDKFNYEAISFCETGLNNDVDNIGISLNS